MSVIKWLVGVRWRVGKSELDHALDLAPLPKPQDKAKAENNKRVSSEEDE